MSFSDIKEREKEEKRNVIIDAAEKLFFEKGFDNVAMEDIAKAVGVNRATLYLYFKNKESMYFAVVLRGVRIMNESFRKAADSKTIGIDKLEAIGLANFEFTKRYGDYNKLLTYFGSGRFGVEYNDDAKAVHRLLHQTQDIMRQAIEAGMKDGTIRNDIDPTVLTIFLISVSESIMGLRPAMKKRLEEHGVGYDQYMRDAIRLLGYSMVGPSLLNNR
ncbi:MAG TPA: TetR/AcrR family transcriptional regulator [Methanocella sp.]|nr:TetR/AcrR family transcriptional regulator [Methanocella sp.]